MDMRGKTAFVTGGSGDLGGAIARALAAAGADVAISYVGHLAGATATVEAVQAMGRQGLAVLLDQRDSVAIEAAVAQVVGTFGRMDILVNNAAWNIGIPFPDLDALGAESLGPDPGHESARAVPARARRSLAPPRAWGRPDREHRLSGRAVPGQ